MVYVVAERQPVETGSETVLLSSPQPAPLPVQRSEAAGESLCSSLLFFMQVSLSAHRFSSFCR